jgi:hypothetical protein
MVRNALLLATFALLLPGICTSSYARTWYVNEEGTGDAPTIEAAMDSAAYGDTVLVGAGTYASSGVMMGDGVTLKSELGPTQTTLIAQALALPAELGTLEGFTLTGGSFAAVGCFSATGLAVKGNIICNNSSYGIFCNQASGEISNNTIVDNGESGIHLDFGCEILVIRNICVGNSYGILVGESYDELIQCNDSWDNRNGDIYGVDDPASQGNFSEDPAFCDPNSQDYSLHSTSPCLPGNHPNGFDCGLIGALGQGCDGPITDVAEEPHHTWSGIKVLFR